MAETIATRSLTKGSSPGRLALKIVFRLIRPTVVTAAVAALIATADPPAGPSPAHPSAVTPTDCGMFWTKVGGSIIWKRDPNCLTDSPPSPLPPGGPPPADQPGAPPPLPPN